MITKSKKVITTPLITIVLSVILAAGCFAVFPAAKTDAAAPGCSASRPTAITGSVYGFAGDYNNWSVNVLIGMDLLNSSGQKVSPSGAKTGSGYSYVDTVNPHLAPPGSSSGFKEVGTTGGGVLCVASNVKTAWFELYPKNQSGQTDKTYFGGANYQRAAVQPGATNTFHLRLPTSHAHGGNTGDINGYITYHSHSVNPSDLKFEVFPTVPASSCGVHGFSAGADVIGVSASRDATYYLVKNMAGGQCNASTQTYKVTVNCLNGACGSEKSKTQAVKVGNGSRPNLSFGF